MVQVQPLPMMVAIDRGGVQGQTSGAEDRRESATASPTRPLQSSRLLYRAVIWRLSNVRDAEGFPTWPRHALTAAAPSCRPMTTIQLAHEKWKASKVLGIALVFGFFVVAADGGLGSFFILLGFSRHHRQNWRIVERRLTRTLSPIDRYEKRLDGHRAIALLIAAGTVAYYFVGSATSSRSRRKSSAPSGPAAPTAQERAQQQPAAQNGITVSSEAR